MGVESEFKKVKLFSGVIYRDEGVYEETRKKLEERFSPVDLQAGPFDFDFTTYYNTEMGTPLYRRFISFERLIAPEELPGIKLFTNEVETASAINGNRIINLDPGYLSDANVIIATTKNYYQRVPLTQGIYAHMEYILKGKKLLTLEWTYPDFRTPEYMDFFDRLKLLYKQNLKEL